jgi:hypothetical protein
MKLRYLPTSEELWESTLPEAERKRRQAERKRPVDKIYFETARILLSRGLDPSNCDYFYCQEAFEEAKRRLGPEPLIS